MILIQDIISVPDSHGNQVKVYVVDVSPDLNEAYGIKLTNGGKADLRIKLNKDGWNYLVPWNQLSVAKVIKQHVKLEEINTPTDTKEDMKNMNNPSTVTSRQATPDEVKKYGIKTPVFEWFVDVSLPSVATIGINNGGIHLNMPAVEQLKVKLGDTIVVGFAAELGKLVIKKDPAGGLKLRKSFGKSGSMIAANDRLVAWLKSKGFAQKRYTLSYDHSTEVFYLID